MQAAAANQHSGAAAGASATATAQAKLPITAGANKGAANTLQGSATVLNWENKAHPRGKVAIWDDRVRATGATSTSEKRSGTNQNQEAIFWENSKMPSVEPAESAKDTESAQEGSSATKARTHIPSALRDAPRRLARAASRAATTMKADRSAETGMPANSTYTATKRHRRAVRAFRPKRARFASASTANATKARWAPETATKWAVPDHLNWS